MGLIPHTKVEVCHVAPLGDPIEIRIRDYKLTLRKEDADNIEVLPPEAARGLEARAPETGRPMPYDAGAGGQSEQRQDDTLQPAHRLQPARGQLSRRKPSSRRSAWSATSKTAASSTCPASNSIRPYSMEEIVARDFLLNSKPEGIINIVDATNIERNLYLTLQLIEIAHPDGAGAQHDGRGPGKRRQHRHPKDVRRAGIPVVPSARQKTRESTSSWTWPSKRRKTNGCPGASTSANRVPCTAASTPYPTSSRITRRKSAYRRVLPPRRSSRATRTSSPAELGGNELELIEHSIVEMETERGWTGTPPWPRCAISSSKSLRKRCRAKPESRERRRSEKIDRVLYRQISRHPRFSGHHVRHFLAHLQCLRRLAERPFDPWIAALTDLVDAASPPTA